MGRVVILEPGKPKRETEREELSLSEAQALVGGYVEPISVTYEGDERLMLLDEEGKLKPNPVANPEATKLLHAAGGMPDDIVVGTAIILIGVEF